MAKLLLVSAADSVAAHEVAIGMADRLRADGHEVRGSWELLGVTGGFVAALERAAAWAKRVLLVDPAAWWSHAVLRERLARARVDAVEQFAVVIEPHTAAAPLAEELAELPRFVLPTQRRELDAWIAAPRRAPACASVRQLAIPTGSIVDGALTGAIERCVRAALDSVTEHGAVVWICGPAGSGKSVALGHWLRSHERRVGVFVAEPGIEWTCAPEQALLALARAVSRDASIDSVARAWEVFTTARRGPVIVAIDGVEQLLDGVEQLLDGVEQLLEDSRPDLRARMREPGCGLPANVVVVATSRVLPSDLVALAPSIDLDAEPWRAGRVNLVAELVRNANLGDAAAALIERAAANPQLAVALIERARTHPDVLDELPDDVSTQLERTWTRLLARAGEQRAALATALAVVRAGNEPLPRRLLELALSERELATLALAREWLREDGGLLGFSHPSVASFLTAELGSDVDAHARLFDATIAARHEQRDDDALRRYVDRHQRAHKLRSSGSEPGRAWVLDIDVLLGLAAAGTLVERLEQARDEAPAELSERIAMMLDAINRIAHRLRAHPSALASALWTEWVARGVPLVWVHEQPMWREQLPTIRLRNRLASPDRSVRVFQHDGGVRAVAIDATGTRALTGTTTGKVTLWSIQTGLPLAEFDVERWVEGVGLSADGRRAAVGAGRRVTLFDLDGKRELARHDTHGSDIGNLALSSDGERVLSSEEDGDVILWRVAAGRTERLGEHGSEPRAVAISGDGRLGITGGDDERVMIWDLDAGARLHDLRGHEYDVGGVALSHDGARAASVCINHARLWAAREGAVVQKFPGMGMSARAAALVDGGKQLVIATYAERLHRFRVEDGEPVYELIAHSDDMQDMDATPDGEWMITGGDDQTARVWQHSKLLAEPPGAAREITALAPAADGRSFWMSGPEHGVVCVQLDDGARVGAHGNQRVDAVAESEGRVVMVDRSHAVTVFDPARGRQLAQWTPSNDWLRAVAVEPVGDRLAYAGDDKTVYVSSFAGEQRLKLSGATDWVRGLAWVGRGRLLAIDDDGHVLLWDVDAKRSLSKRQLFDSLALYALALSGDRRRVAVGGSATKIAVLALDERDPLLTLAGHTAKITGLVWAHDDRVLVSASQDGSLRVWASDDGRALGRFDTPYGLTALTRVGEVIVAGDAAGNWLSFEIDWDRLLA